MTGSLSGIISSITTTLTNIFFTTAKRLGKIIRESWSSLVEAFKILLLNPDNLMLGDRLKAAAKVIATGASVVAGTLAAEFISNVLPADGFLGGVLSAFSMTFVSGILSCTFLYFLDRSELIKKLVNFLNKFSFADMELAYYRRCAAALDQYAAELMSIDIDAFRKETAVFNQAVIDLDKAVSEDDLELKLAGIYQKLGLESPWKKSGHDTFDDFMHDKTAVLVFK